MGNSIFSFFLGTALFRLFPILWQRFSTLDVKDTGLAVGIIGTMKTLCVELLFINLCVVNALISKEDES